MKLNVDFNRDSNWGQMRPKEREAMFWTVVEHAPAAMLEVGTWRGGGSTYILSAAAYEVGSGILHTIEANKEFHLDAIRLYDERMSILKPHVIFYHGNSLDLIPEILGSLPGNEVQFVLLDGAEDDTQTVKEYDLLNRHLPIGSVIACHDWKTKKMEKLKEIIANDNTWHNIVKILDTDTGFMMFERRAG